MAAPEHKNRLETRANRALGNRHNLVASSNLPGSAGRQLNAAAGNEFILREVASCLKAR